MRRLILESWQPSAVLLAVQLIGVLLYPFMDGPAGRAALSLFGLVVLLFAVRAVESTPALTWVSLLLGLPILVLTLIEVAGPLDPPLLLAYSILLAAFYFYTCYALIRYMFHDRIVTPDELFMAGASGPPPYGWFELLFLSFTNLTSVGLSDILPVLPHGRSIVMIEQVAGLMYVALVISRVVGLQVARYRAAIGGTEPGARP
jgi:hypothetical protein